MERAYSQGGDGMRVCEYQQMANGFEYITQAIFGTKYLAGVLQESVTPASDL